MSTHATTSAHTPGPWFLSNSENPHVYDGERHFMIVDEPTHTAVADIETRPEAKANALLIAAAPDGYALALSLRSACDERLSELYDEMCCTPGILEEQCDDLQLQIDHWNALLSQCEAYLTKAHGNAA